MLLLQPYALRQMHLRNRWLFGPLCMASAQDGVANQFHLLHYATRAMGGVGLVMLEPAAVLSNGRIGSHCLGLWEEEQVPALRQVIDTCHRFGAGVAVQLSHAGRKCQADTVSRVIAPSRIGYSTMLGYQEPDDMTTHEIGSVVAAFGEAASRALAAGADAVEIQAGDGYLIHQFLSPLANQRLDDYGGSTANRARFLVELVRAVRQHWPETHPLFLRVSATDYSTHSVEAPELAQMVDPIRSLVDMLHVGCGGLVPVLVPHRPGYLVPHAVAVRQACNLPVIAEGMITTAEQAEEILQKQQADLIAMGRELIRNPYLPAMTAWRQNAPPLHLPQYERAFL